MSLLERKNVREVRLLGTSQKTNTKTSLLVNVPKRLVSNFDDVLFAILIPSHLKRVKLDRPEVRDDPMDVDSGSLARAETPEEGEI